MLRLVSVFAFVVGTSVAADAPVASAKRATMLTQYKEQIVALSRAIEKSPAEVVLYSRRGDCHLFLAQFSEAVRDFERMISLDLTQDAPHWRLGIAYYFTGEFAKSAKQFEKYHAYDGSDRENGIWKFLADVKVIGIEPARRVMLAYTRFDREPFPSLYEMFAGTKSTAELFDEIKARKLGGDSRVMFFAHYYSGLHEAILGQNEKALALLRAAVASPWGHSGEGGPVYMWQVACLHYEMLSTRNP
jgi:lipoprotein NlpI